MFFSQKKKIKDLVNLKRCALGSCAVHYYVRFIELYWLDNSGYSA